MQPTDQAKDSKEPEIAIAATVGASQAPPSGAEDGSQTKTNALQKAKELLGSIPLLDWRGRGKTDKPVVRASGGKDSKKGDNKKGDKGDKR